MSTRVGEALPDDLFDALSGSDLRGVADRVVVVSTVDDRGIPHPALLSYFEVVAVDRRTIRLATYAESRTTRQYNVESNTPLNKRVLVPYTRRNQGVWNRHNGRELQELAA